MWTEKNRGRYDRSKLEPVKPVCQELAGDRNETFKTCRLRLNAAVLHRYA